MAAAFGNQTVPHMTGGGLGYLYNIQFVSAVPNADEHHEFKELRTDVQFECKTSPLQVVKGKIKVPPAQALASISTPVGSRSTRLWGCDHLISICCGAGERAAGRVGAVHFSVGPFTIRGLRRRAPLKALKPASDRRFRR